ncbi:MAG: hypothetical protein Kow0062_25840 [Acidobacteriota bacterium]|nr:MAG: DUF1109 domain-containing protein [Acidobacteriota bacterium]
MSSNQDTGRLPRRLREELERDHAPVRPLRPPWQRATVVAVWFVGILLAAPTLLGLRPDAETLGMAWLWGPPLVQVLFGLVLVTLALREAVPGQSLPSPWIGALAILAVGTQLASALGTYLVSHGVTPPPGASFLDGSACARSEALLGLPALVVTLWLAVRAYPVRPVHAGLLGGLGAGLFADGVQHLQCGVSGLHHVLVWHLGGMLICALIGAATGWVLERVRAARMARP